jgi:hypothetical protein
MGDDDAIDEVKPTYWHGVEIYRWSGITAYAWKGLRLIWHDPRDRENWKLDAIFNRRVVQLGLGPAVFVFYVREDNAAEV